MIDVWFSAGVAFGLVWGLVGVFGVSLGRALARLVTEDSE